MKELIDGGLIQQIVSAVFPLAQARHAFQRRFGGHPPRQAGPLRSAGLEANAFARRGGRQLQAHLKSVPEGFWGRDATNVTPRRW
jgi:hypothetical protein